MYKAEVAWSQIQGARESQQDSACVVTWPNGFRLLVLADGMGGHAGGAEASAVAVESFKQSFSQNLDSDIRDRLLQALESANDAILTESSNNDELAGMGTTIVALAFDGSSAQWVSVGDSPLWLVRNSEIIRLNDNHSMAGLYQKRAEAGEITPEEAAAAPNQSRLLEAVMGEKLEMIDAPGEAINLDSGDILILASDGVESCSESELIELVGECAPDTETIVQKTLEAVQLKQRPKQDNATLIVLSTQEEITTEDDMRPRDDEAIEELPTLPSA